MKKCTPTFSYEIPQCDSKVPRGTQRRARPFHLHSIMIGEDDVAQRRKLQPVGREIGPRRAHRRNMPTRYQYDKINVSMYQPYTLLKRPTTPAAYHHLFTSGSFHDFVSEFTEYEEGQLSIRNVYVPTINDLFLDFDYTQGTWGLMGNTK